MDKHGIFGSGADPYKELELNKFFYFMKEAVYFIIELDWIIDNTYICKAGGF